MRRIVGAAVLFSFFSSASAWAQSSVDELPNTATTTTVPLASPQVPANDTNTAPPRADSALPITVVPTSPEPQREYVLAGPLVDTLSNHLVLGVAVTESFSFGQLDSQHYLPDTLGYSSPGVGIDLGYGVSRHVVLGLRGGWAHYSGGSDSTDTTGNRLTVGPFVRYHLVQGVRFDPWVGFGINVASLKVDAPTGSHTYTTLDWAELLLGGDWYPSRLVGFGPVAGVTLGTNFSTPAESDPGTFVKLWFGLRGVFDLPGK